ncbi:hypothetical protein DENSPDRAFT_192349 [Dentipellis sp. KUC8613]|nr:hypothetical protein DENSPDRAFT_192349 [Dentipellis sp. KUC8613]
MGGWAVQGWIVGSWPQNSEYRIPRPRPTQVFFIIDLSLLIVIITSAFVHCRALEHTRLQIDLQSMYSSRIAIDHTPDPTQLLPL